MRLDVFAMCNALFDLQVEADYALIEELGLTPGGMHLLEADQHSELVARIGSKIINQAAGGSGANTSIGVAHLGGTACFTSKVGRDAFGPAYIRSLEQAGVQSGVVTGEGATGLCVVLITPDKERTMCTYLGEGRNVTAEDIRVDMLRDSGTLYVTGYLWDTDSQKEAVLAAMHAARAADVPVAMSLADTFCVTRHGEDFRRLLDESVSIVFGNEDEAKLLAGAETAEEAAAYLGSGHRTAFVTLGRHGALTAREGVIEHIPARSVPLVDTTGAGDAFAAGTLYGLATGQPPIAAARMGSALAAEVVSHLGPRPPRVTQAHP